VNLRSSSIVLVLVLAVGCIRPPDVVLLDRKTVLEEQASGELHPLENDLREEAIVPRGVELTRAELRRSGAHLSDTALANIVEIHGLLRSESEYLDDLLVRRCIGEAITGLLVETPGTCSGRMSEERASSAVQRVNRGRRQLWRYLQERRPGATEQEVRTAWRRQHLEGVVCGGQVQSDDGEWLVKRC
jgi:uncharacterized protein YdbL (DUF1318 family)